MPVAIATGELEAAEAASTGVSTAGAEMGALSAADGADTVSTFFSWTAVAGGAEVDASGVGVGWVLTWAVSSGASAFDGWTHPMRAYRLVLNAREEGNMSLSHAES